jgi:hypothetical protein
MALGQLIKHRDGTWAVELSGQGGGGGAWTSSVLFEDGTEGRWAEGDIVGKGRVVYDHEKAAFKPTADKRWVQAYRYRDCLEMVCEAMGTLERAGRPHPSGFISWQDTAGLAGLIVQAFGQDSGTDYGGRTHDSTHGHWYRHTRFLYMTTARFRLAWRLVFGSDLPSSETMRAVAAVLRPDLDRQHDAWCAVRDAEHAAMNAERDLQTREQLTAEVEAGSFKGKPQQPRLF